MRATARSEAPKSASTKWERGGRRPDSQSPPEQHQSENPASTTSASPAIAVTRTTDQARAEDRSEPYYEGKLRSIRRGRALRALHVNAFMNTLLEHRYSKTVTSTSHPAVLCEPSHLRSTQPSTRQAAAVGGPHTAGAGAPAPHPFRALARPRPSVVFRALARPRFASSTGCWRTLVVPLTIMGRRLVCLHGRPTHDVMFGVMHDAL